MININLNIIHLNQYLISLTKNQQMYDYAQACQYLN